MLRVNHDYDRGGALAYLAAYDVGQAKVYGRCAPSTGIKPFMALVAQIMTQQPHASAQRVFWIVDNGSSHRGNAAIDQMINREKLDLPLTYRVRLTYEWDGGDPLRDELRLDLDLYRPLRRIRRETVHDVSKRLDAIHRRLDRWSASRGGLLVLSPEQKRQRYEESFAALRQHQAAEQAAEGGRAGLAGRLLGMVGRLRRRD
jgi:hypothetical protein